ncbi:hypothetical protein ACFSC6_20100 [Rufibacter sediminis]|uniref:Uncharacterized protein n=1 Tax=Rufibacter sediminis TaxID=2762756 RepID=A0ABR6VNL3_9BACT|nr:hypothetical protein [Rufibacter sediminis]MBC3538752.1 hypothetical protein [Rufibacter sediminis]
MFQKHLVPASGYVNVLRMFLQNMPETETGGAACGTGKRKRQNDPASEKCFETIFRKTASKRQLSAKIAHKIQN